MHDRTNYNRAALYEIFLKRAFQFDNRLFDPSNQEYLNLVEAEQGNKHSFLPTREKQLDKMKNRMSKAVHLFLKQKFDLTIKQELADILPQIEKARTAEELFFIIEKGLGYTRKLIE